MNNPSEDFAFFVNATRYTSDRIALKGGEIKETAHVPLPDELYIEEHGVNSDRLIDNEELVKLDGHVRHFYSDKVHRRSTKYIFSLDATWYETDHSARTGAEIKAIGNITTAYQLFLEEEGDKPDRVVPDQETIVLSGPIKHFYAAPPTTFGAP